MQACESCSSQGKLQMQSATERVELNTRQSSRVFAEVSAPFVATSGVLRGTRRPHFFAGRITCSGRPSAGGRLARRCSRKRTAEYAAPLLCSGFENQAIRGHGLLSSPAGAQGRARGSGGGHSGRCSVSAGQKVRPNPSLEWTRTGMALGPRGVVVHHPPRGPNATPARAPQLKR